MLIMRLLETILRHTRSAALLQFLWLQHMSASTEFSQQMINFNLLILLATTTSVSFWIRTQELCVMHYTLSMQSSAQGTQLAALLWGVVGMTERGRFLLVLLEWDTIVSFSTHLETMLSLTHHWQPFWQRRWRHLIWVTLKWFWAFTLVNMYSISHLA